jgi:DNA-directed RNA polymerase sigma subunit (sigma70/sigma32)
VLIHRDDRATVKDLLGVLNTQAREPVDQRFGLSDERKRSYREVGEELGDTAKRARRLVERAPRRAARWSCPTVDRGLETKHGERILGVGPVGAT